MRACATRPASRPTRRGWSTSRDLQSALMILCASGDTHGALDRLYADVADFERSLQVSFEALLHVGDFGVWPDPQKVDRATREHEGAGDFPRWVAAGQGPPRPT